ncbi:hypothetical protein VQ042_24575 [Aurantimonas sp. A2-1-M11]|uniref:hypothetical protein n=1 Tax=Aurantimonas sp. A2-1-M11 TaxID=3113712 RepID=UPI002F95396D
MSNLYSAIAFLRMTVSALPNHPRLSSGAGHGGCVPMAGAPPTLRPAYAIFEDVARVPAVLYPADCISGRSHDDRRNLTNRDAQGPGALVVDSRTVDWFQGGSNPGAISFLYTQVGDRLTELGCEPDFDGWSGESHLEIFVV